MLFGGLCEVEDEVVRVGSKLRVRWMVVLSCSVVRWFWEGR